MAQDAKILEWKRVSEQLADLKEIEMKLRKELISECFNADLEAIAEGTESLDLGSGYKLKATFKANRSFSVDADTVEEALDKFNRYGAEGQILADRLVKWKPELSVSEYRKLPPKFLKIIDEIIITKPASPSLELVEPKVRK